MTHTEIEAEFENYPLLAEFEGFQGMVSCNGLGADIWNAISAVGKEYPNAKPETIANARLVFFSYMEWLKSD